MSDEVNEEEYIRNLECGIEEKDDEIERLQLENHKLHGECGHLQADAKEQKDEIERLRYALDELREARRRADEVVAGQYIEMERLRKLIESTDTGNV